MKNKTLADLEWEQLEALLTGGEKRFQDQIEQQADELIEQDRRDEQYNSPEFNQ